MRYQISDAGGNTLVVEADKAPSQADAEEIFSHTTKIIPSEAPKEPDKPTTTVTDFAELPGGKTLELREPLREDRMTQPEAGYHGFTGGVVEPPLYKNPETALEGIHNVITKGASGALSPMAAVLGPASRIPGAEPVIAAGLAAMGTKGFVDLASQPKPKTVGGMIERAGDLAFDAAMFLPALHSLNVKESLAPRTTEALKSTEKGEPNASTITSANGVAGDTSSRDIEALAERVAAQNEKPAQAQGEVQKEVTADSVLKNAPGDTSPGEIANLSDAEASKAFSAKDESGKSVIVPQHDAVLSGMKLDESAVPELTKLRDDSAEKMTQALKAGDGIAFKANFGKNVWFSGAIEGAQKKGPNYDLVVKGLEKGGESNETQTQGQEKGVLNPLSELSGAGTETPASITQTAPVAPELVGMGGAVPKEFEQSNQTPTGIKNATVEQERAQRGLPPAMQPARRSFGEVWDQTMAKIDQDPSYQDRLIDELKDNPRALTDAEDAALLHRQIDLQNEYGKATRDLAQAYDEGRQDAAASDQIRVQSLRDKLYDLYEINKKSGTETGRGLNARKMMANEDFSLAKMEIEKRAANGGMPLTEQQIKEVADLHQRIAETQKAYDDYVAKSTESISDLEAKRALDKIEIESRVKASPQIVRIAEKIVSGFETRADAARARLREKMGRTSAGVDPTILTDLTEIGAAHLARAALDFTKWSAKMVGEFGDWVKPHLEEVFKSSNKMVEDAEKTTKVGDKIRERKVSIKAAGDAIGDQIRNKVAKGQEADISPQAQKLAKMFVEMGVKDRNELIDSVHAELQKYIPDITRREAMDAISGYGKYKQLTKDEVSTQLRDLKGQMQQVGKLEDMQAGEAPKKTGVERRAPSDEERRLIKQVEEAKKKGGYNVTDPATQLRSALQATQTRLENQIADLQHEIDTKTRIVKERTEAPTSPEIEALKKQRDELKVQRDEIFGKKELSDEQRVKMAMTAVEKSIAEYERRIAAGEMETPKKPSKTPVTSELEIARAKRDALKDQLQELRDLDPALQAQKAADTLASQKKALEKVIAEQERKIKEADYQPKGAKQNRPDVQELEVLKQKRDALNKQIEEARKGPKKTPEQIALQGFKTRTRNRIAELQEKLASGDFSKQPRKQIKLDEEALKLKAENERAKQDYRIGLERDRLSKRSLSEKIQDTFVKWRRGFVLSSPVTLAKLTSAAIQRMVLTPTEEAVGHVIGKAIPGVAKRAPREGGFSPAAESKAITGAIMKGMGDAASIFKTGVGTLDVLFGGKNDAGIGEGSRVDKSVVDFFGQLHGALKAPVKRAEFERSLQKRLEFNAKNGVDSSDPMVMTRTMVEAYKDANRSIFLQDNRIVNAYKRGISALKEVDKSTGKTPVVSKLAATTMETLLPIVKVPTNIVAETLQYATGSVTGSVKLAQALYKGVENLPPEQADLIMRQLKKGSIGAAVLLLGYLNPSSIGGYYQPNKKPAKGAPKYGEVQLYGHNVPSYLLHNPLIETLQLGATIRKVSDSKLRKSDQTKQGVGEGLMAGGLGLIEETPFVRESLETAKAFDPYQRTSFFGELGKSILIPQGLQWAAQHYDTDASGEPIKRNAKTFGQHIESGIPGLRENLPKKK